MADNDPTIEELRSQRDDLDRRLAMASVSAAEDLVSLLASAEVDGLMTAIGTAAEQLDAGTRKRIFAWIKMRADMSTLAKMDLARLRGLIAASVPPAEG